MAHWGASAPVVITVGQSDGSAAELTSTERAKWRHIDAGVVLLHYSTWQLMREFSHRGFLLKTTTAGDGGDKWSKQNLGEGKKNNNNSNWARPLLNHTGELHPWGVVQIREWGETSEKAGEGWWFGWGRKRTKANKILKLEGNGREIIREILFWRRISPQDFFKKDLPSGWNHSRLGGKTHVRLKSDLLSSPINQGHIQLCFHCWERPHFCLWFLNCLN